VRRQETVTRGVAVTGADILTPKETLFSGDYGDSTPCDLGGRYWVDECRPYIAVQPVKVSELTLLFEI
jgi:hypothetical protein